MAITIVIASEAAITALANVPTTTLTDVREVLEDLKSFPLVRPNAANDFGGALSAWQYAEEVTLSTLGTSNVLALTVPLGFLVTQVSARVTEAITGATTWEVGSYTTTGKYIATNSNVALGYTTQNCVAYNPAIASKEDGPIMGGQNEIYVTTDAPATAGKIRVGIAGFFFKPFVS